MPTADVTPLTLEDCTRLVNKTRPTLSPACSDDQRQNTLGAQNDLSGSVVLVDSAQKVPARMHPREAGSAWWGGRPNGEIVLASRTFDPRMSRNATSELRDVAMGASARRAACLATACEGASGRIGSLVGSSLSAAQQAMPARAAVPAQRLSTRRPTEPTLQLER